MHTVSNVLAGVSYVCNCCGCCCGILRGITEYGLEHSVAAANYRASVDERGLHGLRPLRRALPGRRHRRARRFDRRGRSRHVHRLRPLRHGLRAEAVSLRRIAEAQIVHPPSDYAAWEQERLKNRGLT